MCARFHGRVYVRGLPLAPTGQEETPPVEQSLEMFCDRQKGRAGEHLEPAAERNKRFDPLKGKGS